MIQDWIEFSICVTILVAVLPVARLILFANRMGGDEAWLWVTRGMGAVLGLVGLAVTAHRIVTDATSVGVAKDEAIVCGAGAILAYALLLLVSQRLSRWIASTNSQGEETRITSLLLRVTVAVLGLLGIALGVLTLVEGVWGG